MAGEDLTRAPSLLQCGARVLDLSEPRVMGVLNVTPDSFSDGGRFLDPGRACDHARTMIEEGASIIDVGGESTRPGAAAVPAAAQLERVIPVIERLSSELDVPISIDTSDPEVMRAAVDAGASMVNDIRALRAPGALDTAADLGVPVVLMHMQGEPRTMQEAPRYQDVVAEVSDFLRQRAAAAVAHGLAAEQLLLDPGFGFGKRLEHNLQLLAGLASIAAMGFPVLVGLSRKSMLGAVTGAEVADRLAAGVAAAALAVERGAMVMRSHDVRATLHAIRIARAVRQAAPSSDEA